MGHQMPDFPSTKSLILSGKTHLFSRHGCFCKENCLQIA